MPSSQLRRDSSRPRTLARVLVALAAVALVVAVFRPTNARAAGVGVNLDQWASLDGAWQNGNLNANNSQFPEGGVVPFRLAIEGLGAGSHTIHINYDFTAGGHKAYDFLATWNAWRSPSLCGGAGGAISSMCPGLPASSSRAFPADGFAANGLTVNGAEVYAGISRRLTIWGGTITGISGPVHSGSVNGNSSVDFTVTFTSTGPAVLLAWGGHLAQSGYWDAAAGGGPDGASIVSGAPWHMRTLNLDDAGAKNQDRSIAGSAIVGELPAPAAPTPPPAPQPTPPGAPAPTPAPPAGTNSPAANPPGAPAAPTPRLTPPPTSRLPSDVAASASPALVPAVGFLAAFAVLVLLTGRRRRAVTSGTR